MLNVPVSRRRSRRSGSRSGQSLVELALVLPLLLVLLLGALDFGRVFFGSVALTNASRVGANYAATHPDAWALGNTSQQNEYTQLVQNSGTTDCAMAIAAPTFPDGSRDLGNRARVDLTCAFSLVSPFLEGFFGAPVTISSDSTFPIRRGCTDCVAAPAGNPPLPANNCRAVPNMIGQSVAGARLQWTAAGFKGPFEPASAEGWRTISTNTIDQSGAVGCNGSTHAFFNSSVFVSLAAIIEPVPPETCHTVPNVLGMPVADGRSAWEIGFDPALFTPVSGSDTQIISTVTYTPADASVGQCRERDLAISVTYVSPPGPPPPPPCKVPSFVPDTLRSDAQATWTAAGFTTTVQFQGGNWTVVKGQTLVGGSYAGCGSTIELLK